MEGDREEPALAPARDAIAKVEEHAPLVSYLDEPALLDDGELAGAGDRQRLQRRLVPLRNGLQSQLGGARHRPRRGAAIRAVSAAAAGGEHRGREDECAPHPRTGSGRRK